ncbi:DUF1992 domain-containing protein [Knoellia sp. 3-2P3]|uniref:DnaJ family domain-containing protein n=1 Tax=unclassified Knoellia TaxID=2618719 RepID=UPI0023DCB682|nr:DUF1992 domain-containing protein [Knoellia sp. 3-2P3]MDF2093769.1 DUF1992 domain-containing protein [Knoellia sp. 3-2P3]
MDPYESLVERQIREAQERGEFDNLPGAGKPLRGLDSDDPDWWVKQLVQREGLDMTDAMPPALALRKEAAGFPHSLLDLSAEESVRAVLEDFNRRVRLDRLRPVVGPFPPVLVKTVDVDELVAQWQVLRAQHRHQQDAEEQSPRLAPGTRALPAHPSLARYDSEPWWRRLIDLVRGR